jgi:hypothetical protein
MHDDLIDSHGCPCPSGKHDTDEGCTMPPNHDNHLDKAVLTMTTIDPVVCTQQLTNNA